MSLRRLLSLSCTAAASSSFPSLPLHCSTTSGVISRTTSCLAHRRHKSQRLPLPFSSPPPRPLSSPQEMTSSAPSDSTLTILHFNDVYNVECNPTEPCAGAPRFVNAMRSFANEEPLVLFSGDILAPSQMSIFTKGEQMLPVLNHLGVHCACFGNHDFDFGLPILASFRERTTFPWLSSNVIDKETGRPLADGRLSHILEWKGVRIGLMGLVEWEWLETLATLDPEELIYEDFISVANRLGKELRDEHGCDLVIALTHMRLPNDIRLARGIEDKCVQLILGGHDHDYAHLCENGIPIIKSGTDFREFSRVTVSLPPRACKADFEQTSENPADVAERKRKMAEEIKVEVQRIAVDSSFPEDEDVRSDLAQFQSVIEEKMDEVLGVVRSDLDGTFKSVRTGETNLGNFVTDIMVASCSSDCALLNSGTLRIDAMIPAGPFKQRELNKTLPMMDPIVIIQVTGKTLCDALENGVSKYPALEGRFPQVSGISFVFSPSAPPGERLIRHLTKVGDDFIDEDMKYVLATKEYLFLGKDGYDCLKDSPVLVDAENSPDLRTAVVNHFESVRMVTQELGNERMRHPSARDRWRKLSHHRQSLVTLSRRHSLVRQLSHDDPQAARSVHRFYNRSSSVDFAHLHRKNSYTHMREVVDAAMTGRHSPPLHSHSRDANGKPKLGRHPSFDVLEGEATYLNPGLEGRIRLATPEVLDELEAEYENHLRFSASMSVISE